MDEMCFKGGIYSYYHEICMNRLEDEYMMRGKEGNIVFVLDRGGGDEP